MLEFLKQLINKANVNYKVFYNEAAMMNIDTSKLKRNEGFVYIEEYREGDIEGEYWLKDIANLQMYFCRFAPFEETAEGREQLRTQIKQEVVYPFIKLLRSGDALKYFREPIKNFRYYQPPPRFDDNEVSIMLQFKATEFIC